MKLRREKIDDYPPLTPKQIADAMGVALSTVYKWEKGTIQIPAERVLALERITGVPRHELRPDLFPRENRVSA